jgi:AcrR family transcriptional regulator
VTSAPAGPARSRGEKPRQPLSPERIFDVATAIIDADGIEALTMRRLAQELGVAATAIYWHVRTRDDLLRGVLERIIDQVAMPEVEGAPWEDGLRTVCRSLSEVLSHPHIVALSQRVPSNASFKLFHRMVEILVAAGFETRDAVESALLLQTFVFGFAAARANAVSPATSVAMSPESLASWFRASGTESAMLLDLYLTIDYDELFERGIEHQLTGLRTALGNRPAAKRGRARRGT